MGPLDTHSSSLERYVSTARVSEALGVSVTTVKRWVDDGILPAQKTAGGHRKLLMADVIRLAREGNLPQADLAKLVPKPSDADRSDPAVLRSQLAKALRAGDATMVRSLLQGAFQGGYSMATLADGVISPAMFDIGHQWMEGRLQVMHEHRATQTLVSALYELKGLLQVEKNMPRPVAVGGAIEHDHYLLPTLLAKMVLIEAGWNAVNLGPHTPMSAFHQAMDDLKPALIWVTVSHLVDAEKFSRELAGLYREATKRGVAVAVGGRSLSPTVLDRLEYSVTGDKLADLAAYARNLHCQPVNPKRGRPRAKPGVKAAV